MTALKKDVIQFVTTMNRGGLETLLMSLYREVNKEYRFIFCVQKRGHHHYFDEILELGGLIVPIYRENILDYLTYFYRLNVFFKFNKAQILHSHIDTLSVIPVFFSKKNGYIKRISHSHTSNQKIDLKFPFKLLFRNLISKYSSDLVACSYESGKWMYGNKVKFKYIPNGIDTFRYRYSTSKRTEIREKHSIENKFVIGHVGRFDKIKNQKYLIDILDSISNHHPNTILFMIGDGPLKNSVVRYGKSLNLEDRIITLPSVSEIEAYYSAFDFFIFPSLYEGMSLALIEAQVSGLRALVSDNCVDDSLCDDNTISASLSLGPVEWANLINYDYYNRSVNSNGLNEFIQKVDISVFVNRMKGLYDS